VNAQPSPFVPFGPAHLAALTAVALVVVGVTTLVRARPSATPWVRGGLILGIVVLVVFEVGMSVREGWFTWKTWLPLELCDAATVLAVLSLLVPRPALAEVLYFWSASGSVLAMLTPAIPGSFPRWDFVVFFGLHGLVLAAALVLVFGLGLHPRPGAPRRAFLLTLGWTAFVAVMNVVLDTNFMFLRQKPPVTTLLDWLGPWPVYILSGAALGFALFHFLAFPFRAEWRPDARA